MLSMISQQENANQNHNDTSSYPLAGIIKTILSSIDEDLGKLELHTLLVGSKMGQLI